MALYKNLVSTETLKMKVPRRISQTTETDSSSPHLPKSSFPKKQPVLSPFSAVHAVSFWHLKTQVISVEQKSTSVCMTNIQAGSI